MRIVGSWIAFVTALAAVTAQAATNTTTTAPTATPKAGNTTTPTTSNTTTPTAANTTTPASNSTTKVPTSNASVKPAPEAASSSSSSSSGTTPSSGLIAFKSVKGQIYADDKPFYIKGVNWFGAETIEGTLQGLWPYGTTVEEALDLLSTYEVNALRLPLALDSVLNDQEISADQTAGSPSLAGKSYLSILDYIIGEARKRNMLVVLDNHRMKASEPAFPDVADTKKIIPALQALAKRYCDNPAMWNVLGIDLKNEPKGTATWGSGDASTDWDLQAAELGNAVLAKCPRWLLFVEGVQTNVDGVTVEWGQAGGSLQGTKKHPVKVTNMERVVYSPHLLSPGVDFKSPWWVASNFPNNMAKLWDAYFGFVPKTTGNAVVVGAWGAKMEGKDKKWANEVASYLATNNIGSFYWAFNPQSADTGGLVLDDWKTPIADRFELLAKLPSTNVGDLVKKYAQCSAKCPGFGECLSGMCQCYAGWSGPQCDVCTEGDKLACNNFGTCGKDSTCTCDPGIDGANCGGASCDGITCGSSKYAGCKDGQCVCSFSCVGGQCNQCAANSSMVSSTAKGLCNVCPAPDKNGGPPSQAMKMTSVSVGAVAVALVAALASTLG